MDGLCTRFQRKFNFCSQGHPIHKIFYKCKESKKVKYRMSNATGGQTYDGHQDSCGG